MKLAELSLIKLVIMTPDFPSLASLRFFTILFLFFGFHLHLEIAETAFVILFSQLSIYCTNKYEFI